MTARQVSARVALYIGVYGYLCTVVGGGIALAVGSGIYWLGIALIGGALLLVGWLWSALARNRQEPAVDAYAAPEGAPVVTLRRRV